MKKKIISVVAAMSMATVVFAGCGSSNSSSNSTSDVSSSSVVDASSQETADDGEFKSSIMFCGSTSLYPIISSLASSFTDEYVTWDQVDSSMPEENISIYVAPGGSGVGASAVIDGTADFGMIARTVKDEEKEAIGDDYQEFVVARDALTVSVNAENPICDVMDYMDTETIKKIFAGEITTWNEVGSSLPSETINVYIRDLSGGAYEVFQKSVMGDSEVTESATQSASMTELATNIANDKWGIGYAGLGAYNKANQSGQVLKAMKVDGVEPTEETILDETYTIQRPVLFVTGDEITDSEQAFIDYVFSETGYEVVEENGYIPAFTVD